MFRWANTANPFRILYFVFGYIVVFSVWWGFLLFQKNETAFRETVEINQINYRVINPGGDYTTTADYKALSRKYTRQKFMILAEGSVFIALLVGGLFGVNRVFRKEIELAEQQRNFLLSITHELKSPLSTIKISLQTLLKRKLDQEKTDKLVNNSLADLDRLESLVDNILFAAKIERSEPGFSNEEIAASEIVSRIAERFSTNKKQIKIEASIQPEVYLKLDGLAFTSMVINLIENAIKYSDAETEVQVRLFTKGSKAVFEVADHGVGVPVALRHKIFEKFYRIGSEDTRKTKGTGLGLYIVKRFVEIYNGDITVRDNTPAGSVFTVTLPELAENV
ncbi:MAG: HAMP domain-containing sensor histidine kinase [Chitinophagales bacterium]